MAHKAQHAADLESGAVVGVTVQEAHTGDTTTMVETLVTAPEQVEAVLPAGGGIAEVVGDKELSQQHRPTGRLAPDLPNLNAIQSGLDDLLLPFSPNPHNPYRVSLSQMETHKTWDD